MTISEEIASLKKSSESKLTGNFVKIDLPPELENFPFQEAKAIHGSSSSFESAENFSLAQSDSEPALLPNLKTVNLFPQKDFRDLQVFKDLMLAKPNVETTSQEGSDEEDMDWQVLEVHGSPK